MPIVLLRTPLALPPRTRAILNWPYWSAALSTELAMLKAQLEPLTVAVTSFVWLITFTSLPLSTRTSR